MALTVADFLLWCVRGKYSEHFFGDGTSLAGGKGGVVNTIVGVLIMTVLDNGLVMLNVNPNIRTGVQGVIILVAVILTAARGAKVISK